MKRLLHRVHSWLRSVSGRDRVESEMEDEIRFHLEARAADLMREGLDSSEAMRQARIEFGAVAAHKDGMRGSLGLRWWDELWCDVRYGLRILRKSPGFTLIAVGSLALAIGANTTIFSVANEILFERLCVPHAEQLRLLTVICNEGCVASHTWGFSYSVPGGGIQLQELSYPVYQQMKTQNSVLEDLFAFKDLGPVNVTVDGAAQSLDLQLVSGNFYRQMQVKPQQGRGILPSDDAVPNAGNVAVISDGYWARGFGRSPGVIGKVIIVNLAPVTIVGVNPPGFTGGESVQSSPELFMPLAMISRLRAPFGTDGAFLSSSKRWWVEVMGRLKPEISQQQAQASLNVALNAAVRSTMTVDKDRTVPHLKLEDGSKGVAYFFEAMEFAEPLYVLLAMVGFVLLLACANMANLMLARASARQREMAVRLALGAGRWRILRQVLIESLMLSTIGGILGLLLGYLGRSAIPQLFSSQFAKGAAPPPFDWRVFAFTAGITIATGIIFGIAPSWASTRAEIGTALKRGSKTATRHRKAWGGKAIVSFQVAISTLLVVGAALFLHTLINLNSVDPGFRADHLLLFDIDAPSERYPAPKDVDLHARLEETLRAVPGVEGVTVSDVPLVGGSMSRDILYVEGVKEDEKDADKNETDLADTGRDFFKVMGIPILAGRSFTEQDAHSKVPVAVVNQALARKFFPNQNPVGKRFSTVGSGTPAERKWTEIIGICGDTRYNTLRDTPPIHFQFYRQQSDAGGMAYIIRTQMKPEAIVPSLRAAVQRVDRDLPLMDVRTQQEQIDATTQQERMFASLSAGFGVLALALACVGIYGIMAYTVVQRTNEIGIRLALGAERRQVRGMVMRETGWLTLFGVLAGLGVALGLGRLVKSMLYGLQPADPVSLAGAGCLLLAVALVAGWVPAMRASRVEPLEALRHE